MGQESSLNPQHLMIRNYKMRTDYCMVLNIYIYIYTQYKYDIYVKIDEFTSRYIYMNINI